ncbi:DUF4214 domain-containing protein [Vreelandella lionensis]|uniref:DUF4214 domain-containing protein n=1 Tax=Vreelandella lionensis TaxID=1144478 RepID=A0ABW8BY91_9GAMM
METTNAIQQIYIGLLGRAADQEGLQYWTDEIEAGTLTLEQLRANIVEEQQEYQDTFGGQTRAQVVSQLYANLFNRAPDDEGLQYWVNGEGASVNIDQLVLALVNGAAAADSLVLDNRTEVANYYTEELGAEGSFDAELAGAVIADVDGTRASVTQAKASVDNGDIVAETPNEGNAFTLTNAVGETVTGTSGNDTFSGVLDGTAGTLNVGDSINAAGGTDTLNLTVANGTAGLPAGAQLNSVEVLNLKNTSAITADAGEAQANTFTASGTFATSATSAANSATVTTSIDASTLSGVKQIWQENFAVGTVDKLAADQVAGFRKTTDASTVSANAGVASAAVALEGVKGAAADNIVDLTVNGGAAATSKLDTVTVSGDIAKQNNAAGSDAASLALGVEVARSAETITVNSAVKTTLTLTETGAGDAAKDVTTIDLSGSDAGVTADLTAAFLDTAATITAGDGNDDLDVDVAISADKTIDLGAGNDQITLAGVGTDAAADNKATSIALGEGSDKVTVTANLGNVAVATEEDFAKSLITITDFDGSAAADQINMTGNKVTLTNEQQTALNTALNDGGLWAGLNKAAEFADADGIINFVFEGNTYIFDSNNAAAATSDLTTGDTLIQLAGVVELNDSNFVVA